MGAQYDAYCTADLLFYEEPTTLDHEEFRFAVAGRPIPAGWARTEQDDWLVYWPPVENIPSQGWKVHVSACLDNADKVLEVVWDYCSQRLIAFKFLRGRHIMLNQNGKYASRGSSGKLVNIYAVDEEQLELLLRELDEVLRGQPGPYILSDLRYADGPLYVRYGGFAARGMVFDRGVVEPAIVDGSGQLVPDRRTPGFSVPDWVSLPSFLEAHLRARTATKVDQLPYSITEAMHFSNGGGVYRAQDKRTGETVVLKEARPHAGLTADGLDAVARLSREGRVLADLAGLDVVPTLRDRFVLDGHQFMVMDFVDGKPLRKVMVQRHPLLTDRPDQDAVVKYTTWALGMSATIESAVRRLNERGVVVGDLHPYNILVRDDGSVVLVDFEVAGRRDEPALAALGGSGFSAPRRVTGAERDRYALACIRLFLFLPLTALVDLDPDKAGQLADVIAEYFPVPEEFLTEAVDVIVAAGRRRSGANVPAVRPGSGQPDAGRPPALTAEPAQWPTVARSLAAGILAAATPHRDDRLFPGDVGRFRQQAPGLAHGAAGVLYALAMSGQDVHPEHVDWLAERAVSPASETPLGLYDGLYGAAYVLDLLGRRQTALDVVDICLRERWTGLGSDLSGGLAGIGLVLAHLAERTGEVGLADAAHRALDVVADRLGDAASVPTVSGQDHRFAGLLRGSSGAALLFLRAYERTGEATLLDLAETALRQDLRRCVSERDGSLGVNEGWRTMPYLLDGSVGIGMVLDDFLRHRPDDDLAAMAHQIHRAARAVCYVEPGLFSGRAGMVLYLSRSTAAASAGSIEADQRVSGAQIQRLGWHAMAFRGHLAFPGERLMRLSMDFATGSAGVLLAVAAAIDPHRAFLPFLAPARPQISGPYPSSGADRIPVRSG